MSGLDLTTILASSGSALVARLTTHPCMYPALARAISAIFSHHDCRLTRHTVDTLRVRIQTYEGKSMPPVRQLIPKPWTGLYAGLPIALAFKYVTPRHITVRLVLLSHCRVPRLTSLYDLKFSFLLGRFLVV